VEIGLLKFLARLEGLVDHSAGEKVAHFQPAQRLPAARGGGADLRIHAVVGSVFKLEEGFALDVDCVDERGQFGKFLRLQV
jgi:hypothetical protein